LTLTLTLLIWVGILPKLNSGALLQVTPSGGTLLGTRLLPRISIHVFCAMSEDPPTVLTEVIVGGVDAAGLKMMSSTGCNSIAFGATPVWPCLKSKNPTPLICTGMFAVLKLVVALKRASFPDNLLFYREPRARRKPEWFVKLT
jgi:hypothetical protein